MSKLNKDAALVVLNQDIPVDVKLTRGEVIDLIIDSTVEELQAALEQAQAAVRAAQEVTLTQAQIAKLLKDVKVAIRNGGYNEESKTYLVLTAHVACPPELGEGYQKARQEEAAARKALEQFSNRSAAKSAILRKLLEGTDQGKDLLTRIQAVKQELKSKAMASAVQLLLKG